ncbi:hypothetical protein H9Q70_006123 [Fusarium xylarioides]|nr:hypothetical protein H9Q70_006123 [Fusarium xylarioides]KAG5782343.1 hypothetical protein H9Q73_003989 [Fusarium xylarioides]
MTLLSLPLVNQLENSHMEVAIVGAGPRGTSILERLLASASELLPPRQRPTVHVIDSSPGPGSVWRTTQSCDLLMNTVASQITLYTDNSVICAGPVRQGPSLYEWAQSTELKLGPDDYATRAQYGRYLAWVFSEVVRNAPLAVDVCTHVTRAIRLDNETNDRQALVLANSRTLSGLAAVILAQGHIPQFPDVTQQQLAMFAERRGLRYFTPSNPADVNLSPIAPGEPILLRGLGLNFFDYIALLSTGRGGRFIRTSHGLRYHPSGKEPHIYAGSRRGIPYHARGDNEKGAFGRHLPLALTNEVITGFRKKARSGQASNFKAEIWPLISKEIEAVYYEAWLGQDKAEAIGFRSNFLGIKQGSLEEADYLEELYIPKTERWDWGRIMRPYGDRKFSTAQDWHDWLLAYLREDVKQALFGNVKGPLKAALDVMRDLRNEIRLIVDHNGLSGESYRDDIDGWYTPLNAFLSIGPPRERIEQLIALMEAGVLDILGPGFQVHAEDWAWVAHSPEIPNSTVRAITLIEARFQGSDLRRTADELLAHLLHTGQCRPHAIEGYETGGLDVTADRYCVIDTHGRPHQQRFAVGVPTEGVHWVTAAGARPGVNSVTLTDTDVVARAALGAVVGLGATSSKKGI